VRIGVVIPTVPGRERELRRALHSTENAFRPVGVDVIAHIENGHATCGEAWQAGGVWFAEHFHDVNYLLFSADDLIADERWIGAALRRVQRAGELPAPQLFTGDGRRDPRTDDGPDGVLVHFPRVPFVPWALWEAMGPIPPLHYYSDCWIGDRAAEHGYTFRVTAGFAFTHLWSQAGRLGDERQVIDRRIYEGAPAHHVRLETP
jgi:hypothetical protein